MLFAFSSVKAETSEMLYLGTVSIERRASSDELKKDHTQAPPVYLTPMPSACIIRLTDVIMKPNLSCHTPT